MLLLPTSKYGSFIILCHIILSDSFMFNILINGNNNDDDDDDDDDDVVVVDDEI